MTIDELYRFVQLIANKEQRGFIKPSEFNLLAQQAQLDLIHDRVARYKTESEKNKQQSVALVQNHSVLDDIRTVIRKTQLHYNNPLPDTTEGYDDDIDGAFAYPEYGMGGKDGKLEIFEYLHYLRLYQAKGFTTGEEWAPAYETDEVPPGKSISGSTLYSTHVGVEGDIELLTHDQLSNRLRSKVCPIDGKNMAAVMVNTGFEIYTHSSVNNEIIELKETDDTSYNIWLVYICKPHSPRWGYTMVNDQYVYNPSSPNTVQLTLPTKTHREIAQRMLSYIGISLRDQEPMVYAEAKVKDQSMTKR
tara:strand:- start:1107 stop:2018 length:912 start_codon:yes stop_codon:yes gene_type:complete